MRTLIVDTEFTGFTADAKILSIALVDVQSGEHVYVEIKDTLEEILEEKIPGRLSCAQIDDFIEKAGLVDTYVTETVLRQLNPGAHGISLDQAAVKIRCFIESFGEQVVLASDAVSWDHAMLLQLLEETGNWPCCASKLVSQMKDISIENDVLSFDSVDDLPHHALKDAKILADAYRAASTVRS